MGRLHIPENYLFSGRDLRRLIVPLFIEQCLAITVGLCDSIMVSSVGQEAVSAVSLIDNIMVLVINVLTALGTGGAIIAGQYLGQKREKDGCRTTEQMLLVSIVCSVVIMAVLYLCKNFILDVVFGHIEAEVRANCNTYLLIIAAAVPFIALYNVGAATYRAMGDSRTPMLLSLFTNGINVGGNALLIYGCGMGIEGAAIPTLVSRAITAFWMLALLRRKDKLLHVEHVFRVVPDFALIRRILKVGIPYSLENGVFQLGKVMVLSLITTFGTVSIAANAVGNTVGNFIILGGMSISYTISAVTAQCVGARDYKQVRFYTRRLLLLSHLCAVVLNALMILALPLILKAYQLPEETAVLAEQILLFQGFGVMTVWPAAFNLPNALRSSNDTAYCMVISLFSMWTFRIGFSYIFADWMGIGVLGVWMAMVLDWVVRTVFFVLRYRGTKWYLPAE